MPPPEHAFFVSIHIPKTAGTTLSIIFDRVYKKRVFYDYPPPQNYHSPDPLIEKNAGFIGDYFKGLHGHFGARRHLPVFGGAKFVSCVRHPVDRIISQFNHEYNDKGRDSFWHKTIRSGELSVVDFAGVEGVGNAMAVHLTGLALDDYDLLMVSENIPVSLTLMNYVVGNMGVEEHFGVPPILPHANQAGARDHQFDFPESVKQEIFKKAEQDVEIYRKSMELFALKARSLS